MDAMAAEGAGADNRGMFIFVMYASSCWILESSINFSTSACAACSLASARSSLALATCSLMRATPEQSRPTAQACPRMPIYCEP